MQRSLVAVVAIAMIGWVLPTTAGFAAESLQLHTRAREKSADEANEFRIVERQVAWDPRQTAIVICDMWDRHWCQGATRRVAELAPRMNEVVTAARRQGVLIIHCPSSCLEFYKNTPQRKLAQQAPKVETQVPLVGSCKLDPVKEPKLPIDDSDGGCDCHPTCPQTKPFPWRRQIATLEIAEGDAITDNVEAFYLIEQRGIRNVIVMGVHTNMCVLGRSFAIRQMVQQGKKVVLMRDMTDSMYNHLKEPQVDHFRGTELVVEHIEKYWCPTILSSDLTGKPAFRFSEDKRPHVAVVVNKNHYESDQTLPQFAQQLQDKFGYYVSLHGGEPGRGIPGLDALNTADLLLLFVRREPLPAEQFDQIRAYLDAGKPLVALRTASHAFAVSKGEPPAGMQQWPKFDSEVLGGSYHGHYDAASGADVEVVTSAALHPLLAGVEPGHWHAVGELYQVRPVNPDANVVLKASIPGQPPEPVAWFRFYKGKAPIFYTSLGHPDHFHQPPFVRMLTNAVVWALSKPPPQKNVLPYHAARLPTGGEAPRPND